MRNFRWLVICALVVLILGCGDDPIVNPDIALEENIPLPGRIAFSSDRDGDAEIYMMNADGTSLVRLTESKGVDYPSSWSPDGRKLAFVSERNGSYNIYVMSVDGSEPSVQLTHDSEGAGAPSWSPDGRRIAFSSWRDGDGEIYVMDPDGANIIQLTNSDADEDAPSWSPDGQKITFALNPRTIFDPDSEIFVMDADGTNARQLTDNDTFEYFPVWSPDGSAIVFTSRSATTGWVKDNTDTHLRRYDTNIYVMNVDGSDIRQLTHDNISGDISWSPDGEYMAFSYASQSPYVKSEIYIMNANGGGRRALIDWKGSYEGKPVWGPLPSSAKYGGNSNEMVTDSITDRYSAFKRSVFRYLFG